MSNLRLKQDEAFTNILYQLLSIFGQEDYAIKGYGKRIVGYGIKQSKINEIEDKQYPISERTFKHYKNDLLTKRFIKEFGKNDRIKRGPFYSITPLGLFYLMQHIDKYPKFTSVKLFQILEYYDSGDKNRIDPTVFDYFTQTQMKKAMQRLFKDSVFRFTDNGMGFALDLVHSLTAVRFLQLVIEDDVIRLDRSFLVEEGTDLDNIDETEMNFQIGHYVKSLLSYYLYKLMKNPKKILDLPKSFQKNINDVGYQLAYEIQQNLIDISNERVDTFGSYDVMEVQEIINTTSK